MLLAGLFFIIFLQSLLFIGIKELNSMVEFSIKRQSILLSRLLVFEDTYGNEFVIRVKTDSIDNV